MSTTKGKRNFRWRSDKPSTLSFSIALDGGDPLKKVEYRDSVNQVHELIEKLPDQQKMVIQLRDVEQYDFDEICEMLDMKPTAVRVALSRARKTIRKELIKQHNYGVS